MPLQSALMTALDATSDTHPRKWWSAELGMDEATLSRWKHGTRDMPVHYAGRILEVLGEIAPEIAAEAARALLRPAGLTVAALSKPVAPAERSRRTFVASVREQTDVTEARMDADEDGIRTVEEIRRELHEAREAHTADGNHVTALEQELAAAETVRPLRAVGR